MPSILCVDDFAANRALLQMLLERWGYTVLLAATGQAALELAEQHLPDLIVMDLRMPEATLSGYTAIRRLKANPTLAEIPIIAVSAAGSEAEARAAGCDAFLARPFEHPALLALIEQFLV